MTIKYTEETIPSNRKSLLINNETTKVHIRIVPSIENPSRSLIFNIIERDLERGKVIRIGRFTDKSSVQNHISFKSKVVSRSHCEIWLNQDGQVQLKDTKSSSGTFVNHVRLSSANQDSKAAEIRDGDLVQLGVDYQGGIEEIYRSVKMRIEINRQPQKKQLTYSVSAFNNLRNITNTKQQLTESSELEECCICLYALAPFQALFVAPCSHTYHFKCIRPLFDSYPGFQCPVCRTYSDLEENVAMETEEVIEKFGLKKNSQHTHDLCGENLVQPLPSQAILSDPPLSTTLVACTTSLSGMVPLSSSTEAIDSDDHQPICPNTSTSTEQKQRASKYIVEKIKLAFSNDKRKSTGSKRRMNSSGTSSSSSDEMERSDTYFDLSATANLNNTPSHQSTHYNSINGVLEEISSNTSLSNI